MQHILPAEIIKRKLFQNIFGKQAFQKQIYYYLSLIKGYKIKLIVILKIEVASNDGSFLNYLDKKFNTLIVELILQKTYKRKKCDSNCSFFNFTESKKI